MANRASATGHATGAMSSHAPEQPTSSPVPRCPLPPTPIRVAEALAIIAIPSTTHRAPGASQTSAFVRFHVHDGTPKALRNSGPTNGQMPTQAPRTTVSRPTVPREIPAPGLTTAGTTAGELTATPVEPAPGAAPAAGP